MEKKEETKEFHTIFIFLREFMEGYYRRDLYKIATQVHRPMSFKGEKYISLIKNPGEIIQEIWKFFETGDILYQKGASGPVRVLSNENEKLDELLGLLKKEISCKRVKNLA